MSRSIQPRPRISTAVMSLVAAGFTTSCSFMGLDDLELVACDRAMDCYASPDAAAGECYRCRAGRCEPAGKMRVQSTDDVLDVVLGVRATREPEGSTLVTIASEDHVRGWRVTADSDLTDLGAVQYFVGDDREDSICPSADNPRKPCIVRDHAGASLPEGLALGMSIDLAGCATGRVQLGLTNADAPLQLQADAVRGPLAGGIPSGAQGCTIAGGASAPAIASGWRAPGAAPHALAVWLGTPPRAATAAADGCSGGDGALVPVWSQVLTIESSDGDGWTIASPPDVQPDQRGASLSHLTPQLLAAPAQGEASYLLAFADRDGIRLMSIPSEPSPAAARLEPVTRVGSFAMALGRPRAGGQEVMIAWRRECGAASELWTAIYRWSGSAVERVHGPRRVRTRANIVSGPAIAFAQAGFALGAPAGGWSVAWLEVEGTAKSLQVTHVAERSYAASTPTEIHRGDATFPFLHAATTSPFSYGFISKRTQGPAEVAVLACD